MLVFDKQEIREKLNIDDIYNLLQEWGGDPEMTNFGILSATICHNKPGDGSKKLYYYENNPYAAELKELCESLED